MQVILLGTGTPIIDPSRQHSALLVEVLGERILFDAGRGVTSQMAKMGLLPQQINAIFITHHHYDHIGNLGEFLLTAWHNGRKSPVTVYGPPGTGGIVSALFDQVYARDIAWSLATEIGMVDIRKLVQVKEVSSGLVCENDRWKVVAEYVDHGNSSVMSRENWPCLGYRVEALCKVIAISGDCVDCDGLDRIVHAADCLIQCCYLAEAEITGPDFEYLARYVIASSSQVGKIAARNQVKKLVLTHIRPKSEALMRSLKEDIRRTYQGDLVVGEDLMVIEV
jgi:ribonuclease BN (tRNA processing enzyme)